MSENTMTAEQATISVLAEDAARTIATLMTKNAEQRVRILQLEHAVEQLRADAALKTNEDSDAALKASEDSGAAFDDPDA